jgi:molybdopterin/thiamine biosynthesis adenylyltransferase
LLTTVVTDKYARQQGLVAQDLIADARVTVIGSGPALPYLLQCLALLGLATRHGRIRLEVPDRPVLAADLGGQFLLRAEDVGTPLGAALAGRITCIEPTIQIGADGAPSAGELRVAVPRASEAAGVAAGRVAVVGQVLAVSCFVGPTPVRVAADPAPTVLTPALAATCGALLAQALLGQLGAIVDGPRVVSRWLEERFWIAYPKLGRYAGAVEASGAIAPSLGGVLNRMDPAVAGQFSLTLRGRPLNARITTIVDDDAVVVTVPVSGPATGSTVRPKLAPPPSVEPLLWSPIVGPALDGDTVVGDDVVLPDEVGAARIVLCGVGALGSWASAVLAAARIPGLDLSVVDMDDAIETHNLNRQVLFGDADLGLPKARRAVERLREIDPGLTVRALQVMIAPDMADELSGGGPAYRYADIAEAPGAAAYRDAVDTLAGQLRTATAVLSCPDNHQTRWSLNVIAERLGIALVNGAVDGFVGRVHVCAPADHGRCLVCWLGTSIAEEPERQSCTDVLDAPPVASIVTSAAVVGSAQAAALIAHLAGLSHRMARFHAFDGVAGRFHRYRTADRDPQECPAHLVGTPTPAGVRLPGQREAS